MVRSGHRRFLLGQLSCLALLASLVTSAWCDPAAQWSDFESVRVRSQQAGSPAIDSTLQFSRSSGDFQVDIGRSEAGTPENGTILMVAGQVMLSKGLTLTPGSELAALDQPLLMYAVVSSTLSRVLPAGPDATPSRQKISHVDTAVGIDYASANAHGHIPSPWSVEGSLQPTGNRSFAFDLVLKWSAAGKPPVALNLKGTLARQSDFHLDDSMDIDDFRAFDVEQHQSTYAAKAMTDPPRTIGEIRRALSASAKTPATNRK